MFYPQNLHTHTIFCDGKHDVETMVQKAEQLGLTSIGFSGHSHCGYISTASSMTHENTRLYKAEIAKQKERYAGRMEIFCGLEFDQYSDDDLQGCEYVIGANHYLKLGNEYVGFDRNKERVKEIINDYFDGDGLRFAREYYRQFAQLPAYGKFDIVGHFDLITKNNEQGELFDENSPAYRKYALECLYALAEKIHVFEINTGAMARGYRTTPYPNPFILREMAKMGVGITISSDCHDGDYLTHGFDRALELCKECGVKELQVLTKGGFKSFALDD